MIRVYVELSGEAPELARAEAGAAAEALGGRLPPDAGIPLRGLFEVQLPDRGAAAALVGRLALAHRCLVPAREGGPCASSPGREGADGRSAAFRRVGRSAGSVDEAVRSAGRDYRAAGGTIDLERPERRYWLAETAVSEPALLLEIGAVDRRSATARTLSRLPFRRPVALAPRLARAAANLARIRAGDRILDPFLGTGALLAEAALLGGRTYGIDRDPAMIRGALRNFAHLSVPVEELVEGDAREVEFRESTLRFDAIVSDPPYGRSSGTGGERAEEVARAVLERWAARVRPGGRAVVVRPDPVPVLSEPWVPTTSVSVRVHRSLTRTFVVYARRS